MNRNRKFCLLLMIVAIGLCTVAAILDLNQPKSSEMSFSWDRSSITLKPTEIATGVFTNPDNVPVQLTVVDISAPAELVPYIVATPSTIPENSQQTVTILFIRVPLGVLDNIVPDTYSVRIGDLLVYLDMTAGTPVTTENVWSTIDNLNLRIAILEAQQLADNAIIENQQAEIALLKVLNLPENIVTRAQLDNVKAYYDTAMARQQYLFENEIIAAKGDASSTAMKYAGIMAVVAAIVVMLVLRQYGRRLGIIPPEKRLTEDPPKIVKED